MRDVEAECAPAVDAAGCEPPVFWPANAPGPEEFVEQLGDRLESCGLVRADVRFDCSEFPCFVYAPELGTAVDYDCLGIRAESSEEDPAGIEQDFALLYAALDRQRGNLLPAIERRKWGRLERLAESWSNNESLIRGVITPSCDEAERLLAMPRCEAHREHVGCKTNDPLAISREQRRAHVTAAEQFVDGLQRRCSTFEDSTWFLNCERTPCVIGFDATDLEERGVETYELLCGHALNGTASFHINRNHGRAVAMVPLVGLEEGALGDVLRDRWDDQLPRRWEDIGSYLGADRAASLADPEQ